MRRRTSPRQIVASQPGGDHHDFTVGEPVMTLDGVPGRVVSITDGPIGGAEIYGVELDGGMGGGDYDANQISSMGSTAKTASIEADGEVIEDEFFHLASDDYPELAEILTSRPPPPRVQPIASLQAEAGWTVVNDSGEILYGPVQNSFQAQDAINELRQDPANDAAGLHVQRETDQRAYDGWGTGRDVDHVDYPEATYSSLETPVAIRPEGSFIDRVLDPIFRTVDEKFPENAWRPDGNRSVADWCRFRRDSRCYYPKEFDYEATKAEGYAVWIPYDRGLCGRGSHEAQAACSMSEPGPHSGEPESFLDATIPYEDGGQRGGVPTMASLNEFGIDLTKVSDNDRAILIEASQKPEFGWHLTAAWNDVQSKAKDIRRSGGVRVLAVTEQYITAEVKGDTGVYEARITKDPAGGHAIAMWECGCEWGKYAWGRTGRWKKFEGRVCSHVLALNYEVQSQSDYGGTVTETPAPSFGLAASLTKHAMPPIKADPTVDEIVDWYVSAARAEEPTVSGIFRQVADRFGGQMEGLAFALKGEGRMREKITERLGREPDPRLLIKDALRYTMVFHPSIYTFEVQKAMYALKERGFKVLEEENSWPRGDSYSGLHFTLATPQGLPMELQFHTEQSFSLKQDALHALYEEFRESGTSARRKQELFDIMSAYWDEVEIPDGVLEYARENTIKTYMRPVAVSSSLRPAPLDIMKSAWKDVGAWAKFRGRLVQIICLLPDRMVKIQGGDIVSASEIEHPKYDPREGLQVGASLQVEAMTEIDMGDVIYRADQEHGRFGERQWDIKILDKATNKIRVWKERLTLSEAMEQMRRVHTLVYKPDDFAFAASLGDHPCSACNGTGEQDDTGFECYICDGSGTAEAEAEGRALGEDNSNPENGHPVGIDHVTEWPDVQARAALEGWTDEGVAIEEDIDHLSEWPDAQIEGMEPDVEAVLHDEPEPALPTAVATEDDPVEAMVRQATGGAPAGATGLEWLMAGTASQSQDSTDIAAAAAAFLETGQAPAPEAISTTAVRRFTPAEQQVIINEGEGVTAANIGDLDLAGTHYEPIAPGDDDDLLW